MDIDAEVAEVLLDGDVEVLGALRGSSNGALLVELTLGSQQVPAIYKPTAHERALHDFPDHSLAQREVATGLVDTALGWDLVPVTVWRETAPMGPGMFQQVAEPATEQVVAAFTGELPTEWLPVMSAVDENDIPVIVAHRDTDRLRQVALLDIVTNNADRKAGHLLGAHSSQSELSAVDHGLTFNTEPKLRTVLWGFSGNEIAEELLSDLSDLAQNLQLWVSLAELITDAEISVTRERLDALVQGKVFPDPPTDRYPVPWPIV